IEIKRAHIVQRERADRFRLFRDLQDALEYIQRCLGLAVNVDDVAELLQRSEDEERVNPQRKELTHRDIAGVNQVKHQEEDARPEKIHRSALNEAQAPEILHLLQFQLQDFPGSVVQPFDFLLSQPET